MDHDDIEAVRNDTTGALLLERALRCATDNPAIRVEIGAGPVFTARVVGMWSEPVAGSAEHSILLGAEAARTAAVSHLVAELDRRGVFIGRGIGCTACAYALPPRGDLEDLVDHVARNADAVQVAMLMRGLRAALVCPYPSSGGWTPGELQAFVARLAPHL